MNSWTIILAVIGVIALIVIGVLVDRWIEVRMNAHYNFGDIENGN